MAASSSSARWAGGWLGSRHGWSAASADAATHIDRITTSATRATHRSMVPPEDDCHENLVGTRDLSRRRVGHDAPVRAALFITCFNDTLFPQTGRATVAVLERLGVQVDFPLEQTCCGQMHANSGYGHEALGLVRRFVRVFGDAEAVVAPSGSCAAMVREGYERMATEAGDEALAAQVRDLAPRVFELSEFLVARLGVQDVGASFH